MGLREYAPAWFGLVAEVRYRHLAWKRRMRGRLASVLGIKLRLPPLS